MIKSAFGDQLRAFANKVDERGEAVLAKIIFDVSTRIVLKSPVGNPKLWKRPAPPGYVGGRFRANWQYGADKVNRTTTENKDKTGGPTISRLHGSVSGKLMGRVHYITNSLVYAIPLENGHSSQAPPGHIVAGTVLEFDPIVAAAVAELR